MEVPPPFIFGFGARLISVAPKAQNIFRLHLLIEVLKIETLWGGLYLLDHYQSHSESTGSIRR